MKILHRVLRIVVLVALVSVGVGLLALCATAERWQEFLVILNSCRDKAAWLGVLMVCVGLLYMLTGTRQKKRAKYLSFNTEEGTVSISTQAISDYITKVAGEFTSIVRMWTTVIPGRNCIDIRADLRVKAGAQVHEVCQLLQKRIREAMNNGLGISDVRSVQVSVKEIVSEHQPA